MKNKRVEEEKLNRIIENKREKRMKKMSKMLILNAKKREWKYL